MLVKQLSCRRVPCFGQDRTINLLRAARSLSSLSAAAPTPLETAPEIADMKHALVLGAGGHAAHAWEIGVPVGYSNSNVPIVKPTQDWQGEYASYPLPSRGIGASLAVGSVAGSVGGRLLADRGNRFFPGGGNDGQSNASELGPRLQFVLEHSILAPRAAVFAIKCGRHCGQFPASVLVTSPSTTVTIMAAKLLSMLVR
jgi:hypothetical protein